MPYPTVKFVRAVQDGVIDPYWGGRLREICDKIASGKDLLRENYIFENLDLAGHMTFDLLVTVDTDEIVAFSGVYRRDFWPDGVWRFMNRTWLDPRVRSKMRQYDGPSREERFFTPRYLTRPQIAYAKTRAKALFLSMEGERAWKRLRFIATHDSPVWQSGLEWRFHDKFVQVAQCDSQPCWQQFIYANIEPGYDLSAEPWAQGISVEEWRKLGGLA